MIKFPTLLFLLLAVGVISAQTPELGLLPPQVYVHKQLVQKGTMSLGEMMGMNEQRNLRNAPEISAFTDPLENKIAKEAPGWLRALEVGELAILEMGSMSEDEKKDYLEFHNQCALLHSLDSGGMNLGRKSLQDQTSVALKGASNKLADKLDRDYLLLIDVYGFHTVNKKKSKEKIDPQELKGSIVLVVSIIDAATGIAEVARMKSTLTQESKPKKINAEQILKDLESLVEKAYTKFSKQF